MQTIYDDISLKLAYQRILVSFNCKHNATDQLKTSAYIFQYPSHFISLSTAIRTWQTSIGTTSHKTSISKVMNGESYHAPLRTQTLLKFTSQANLYRWDQVESGVGEAIWKLSPFLTYSTSLLEPWIPIKNSITKNKEMSFLKPPNKAEYYYNLCNQFLEPIYIPITQSFRFYNFPCFSIYHITLFLLTCNFPISLNIFVPRMSAQFSTKVSKVHALSTMMFLIVAGSVINFALNSPM